jgi:hypothetical protein
MGRAITAAMATAISAVDGYANVWLIQLTGSDNTIRYSTAPSDVSWNSQTWVGIGGLIDVEAPAETTDPSGQSLKLSFSGVQQSVIAEVLTNQVRGRTCTVYWAQILISTGVVVADPITIFSGLMNSRWEMAETPSDLAARGSVRVSTTVVSQFARYLFPRATYTNFRSLRTMQERSTRDIIGVVSVPDLFFTTLPDLGGRPVYWGRKGAITPRTGTPAISSPSDRWAL